MRRVLHALLIAGAITGAVASVRASEHSGLVTFNGLPVPGAIVTATQDTATLTTATDAEGSFHFADLADGVWTLRVEMIGFAAETTTAPIGPESPPTAFALSMRPFDQLKADVQLSVPVSVAGGAAAAAKPNPEARSADPAEPGGNVPSADTSFAAAESFLVNGSVNNGAASPFAQMAAFGNNRRGQRSLYNGGLGIVLGNSAWDARPFSFTSQPSPKPSYDDVQILGTFGGPLRLPGITRNGPNIFAGYQRTVDHSATTQSARVPTWLERRGDFSQTRDAFGRPIVVVDPRTGLPFPGNTMPRERISPQAASLLNYYPGPNAEGAANYQTPTPAATHQNNVQLRATQTLGRRDSLFGNVLYSRTRIEATDLFGFTDSSLASATDAAINWSHRFSQFFSLRTRYQYLGQSNSTTPYFAGRTNVSGDAGIAGSNQDTVNWGPPRLNFVSGLAGLSGAQYADNRARTHTWSAEGFRGLGRHNLTIGGGVARQRFDVFTQQDARGTFSFTGTATGSDVADFLLGLPSASAIAFGNADKLLSGIAANGYVNDDWRVSPSLTVNAGVRWEYESPLDERFGRLANLRVAHDFSTATTVAADAARANGLPPALVRSDWRGIQPRAGIAWRPVAGSSLVVRAGYGLYRNTAVYQSVALLLAQQPPFSKTLSVASSPSNPLTLADGFVGPAGASSNTFAADPDFRIGAAHNWQASAQRDLPGSLTVLGSYLGTRGTHLMQEFLPNTYPAGMANPCPTCPSGFVYLASNGTSLRNSGQVQLRRRLRNGLSATAEYTLAKATDDAAAFVPVANPLQGGASAGVGSGASTGIAGATIAQDWLDLDGERARSTFDQRHLLSVQVQYTTGMGVTGGALLDGRRATLLNGWTMTSQMTIGSGLPLTPMYLAPVAGTGVTGTIRASLTGASAEVPGGYYLNPVAYSAPLPGQWGSAGRNSVGGPAQFGLNAGLGRTFQWGDRVNLDWRLDAANVLNRATYSSVDTVVGSPQFGLPNRANAMRKVQTSLRLRM